MLLLDRYLLRELLLPLAYCLCGFLIFWISSDLIEDINLFHRNGLSPLDVGEYYLVRMPELLVLIVPIALLLAQLYALTNLARHQELTAMRAAGLSLWRLGLPYLGVGLLASLSLFYLNETWAPGAMERAHAILNRYQKFSGDLLGETGWQPLNFKNDRDNRIWTIGAYNAQTAVMKNPKVDWIAVDGTRFQLIAERGQWLEGHWLFSHAIVYEFIPGQETPQLQNQADSFSMGEFTETPELIKSEIKFSNLDNRRAANRAQLSVAEIHNYMRLHRRLPPLDQAKLRTQLYGRLAEPWTCIVVSLIALPFGAVAARRNVFVGVAASLFLCFAYFVLQKLGLALGTGGYAPPWLATWLPNLLFGGLGIWMTSRAS